MYDLAQNGMTAQQIDSLLRTNREISFEYELLNNAGIPLGRITAEGTIDFDSEAKIKRAARFSIKEEAEIDFLSELIKPYMCVKTSQGKLRFPLGVFLMSSPSRVSDGITIGRSIECYDKTQILSDDKFDTRYRVPSGTNYIGAVSTILVSAGFEDAILTQTEKETASDIEFDIGTSKLTAINKLLNAINYNDIYADSYGRLVAKPYAAPETRIFEASYATDKSSIVFPGGTETLDVFGAPNKIVRYLESADREYLVSSVTNDDVMSKLSTVNRGRTIVDIAAVSDIADQATLDAYVLRIAAEKKIYEQILFDTALMPNHEYLDCLYVICKDLDIHGKFIETAWNMELKVGGRMSHTCRRVVSD